MSHINQVILLGFLGRDPESLKATNQGAFVRLTLATSQNYLNATGQLEKTTQWHTVFASKKMGEFALANFKKGAKLFVKGQLKTTTWQDKQGERRYQTAVYADDLQGFSAVNQSECPQQDAPVLDLSEHQDFIDALKD